MCVSNFFSFVIVLPVMDSNDREVYDYDHTYFWLGGESVI
jgi:hypothetical protein